jgi:hypothetical protein
MKVKITKVLLIILQIFVYFIFARIVVMLLDSSVIANIGITLPFGWPSWVCKSISSQWGFPFTSYRCPPPEFWCDCYRNTIAGVLNFLFSLGLVHIAVLLLKKITKSLFNKIKVITKKSLENFKK